MSTIDEETAKKVFRQVEFYFCNSNLPKDQFLMNTINESEDGMVSLALICSFSRMKSHLGLVASSADEIPDDIIKAVADTLKPSQLLKISDDGKKVGRKVELSKVDELLEQQDSRTIAVSPLPYDATREDVESFFAQHVKVNSVRLPMLVSNKKMFSGTALIELTSDENVEKMLKQKLAYAGVDLEFKPKKEFDEEREKQIAESGNSQSGPQNHKSPPEPSYPKGLIVAFTLKSISSKDDTAKSAELEKPESASEEDKSCPIEDNKENTNDTSNPETDEKRSPEDADEKKSPVDADEKDEKKGPSEVRYNYNNDKDNKEIIFREDLKSVFGKFGIIKFVDFSAGADTGYIRFEEAEASQKARAAAVLSEEGGLVVKNFIVTLEPVTGEAEKEYWSNNVGPSKERFRDNRGNRGGRGGKFNRRGGKHGRYRDNEPAGRHSKNRRIAT